MAGPGNPLWLARGGWRWARSACSSSSPSLRADASSRGCSTHVASTRSRELFTLTVLVVALGIAVASAKVFGVSMALGAFLAGMVVGRSEFSVRAASEALPMRDAFAVLFFVSVGMLLDPRQLLRAADAGRADAGGDRHREAGGGAAHHGAVPAFPQGRSVRGRRARPDRRVLVHRGDARQLDGRAACGCDTNARRGRHRLDHHQPTPVSIGGQHRQEILQTGRLSRPRRTTDEQPESRFRAIVVGYGPIGRTVGRLLRDNEIEPTIIEMNMDTVKHLRLEGVQAIYGDASQPNTLASAGVSGARGIIISVAGMPGVEETIRLARELNPEIQTLVRTTNLREASALAVGGRRRRVLR